MRKIFLDCGTHYGEGLAQFVSKFAIDHEWEVYSFEPNLYLWQEHINNNILDNVHYINKAIYIHNDNITFNIAYPNTDASSIYKNHIGDANFHGAIEVECLDLSEFILSNFTKDDFIVIKMDIEGAEYEVLRKMIADKSILYVDDLSVEFHSHKDEHAILETGENKETTFELIKEIQDLGVKFTHWM
jgi:FkbM family methyltransferase